LETRTEGWIAGLQMAALSMRNRSDSSQFIHSFAGSHRFVLDYLMEEVLHQQPQDIQAFLLKTSILDRLTEPLCDAITGGDDSRDMMYELDQANLFLMPLDDDRQWYRYHHLFADLLRSRLQQTWPEQVPELHLMASEWFEGEGLIEQAIQHAFQAEQMRRAADLVESYAIQVISQSKAQTLLDWIESLPADLIALRPLLCAYLGWSRYWTGKRESVEECLQLAEQGLRSSPEKITESKRTLIEGYIAAIRAYLAITNEDIFRVIEMSQKALELLPEDNYMRGIAAVALGVTYWGLGDALRSQAAFQQAVDIARKGGYRNLAISAMCYVGIQMEKRGQLHEAFSTYNEAMERSTKSGSRWMPLSCFPVERLGNLWREWNDLDKAAQYVNEGVAGCEKLGHPDIMADGYITQTRLLLARNDLMGAKKGLVMLDHLAETANTDPWADTWIDECRLAIWIRDGNLEAAVRWVDSSQLIIDYELSYLHDLNHINLARVLIAQGSQQSEAEYLVQAHELLSRLLEAAMDAGWVQDMIKIRILQSLAYLYQKDVDSADKCIREALSLAEAGGYVRIFVDEGEPMEKLLQKAADEGFMRDYTKKLLQNMAGKEKEAALPSTQPSDVDRASPLIEPLTDREQQVLRLLLSELSVPEIADELIVGVSTVRTHVKNIYAKLGVHSRYQAVSRARQIGLL
ncbi:MAG: LuxR C-terminal-related transcriptional regulator, partial [Chloroflexota bacterium]|nr:LuxR C-terminal-related transcriptional regulator [Chloroflexota bacterium]